MTKLPNGGPTGSDPSDAADPSEIEVFVEVPMGSRNKYEWDFDRRSFTLDRMLFSAVRYPGDYGFVPETHALDGDHLDALVILGEPTFPGCTLRARILGVLDMEDDKGQDEKLLTVASHDPRWAALHALDDVPAHLREEISHFFATYKQLERRHVVVRGWRDHDAALAVLAEARARWAAGQGAGSADPTVWPR